MGCGAWCRVQAASRNARIAGAIALALTLWLVTEVDTHAVGEDPLGSSCHTTAESFLNPSWITIGNRVNVRTRLRFECPDRQHGYHLVIVVDMTATGPDGPAHGTVDQLASLFDRLEMDHNPRVWVGVVGFGPDDWARVLCPVTNDLRTLKACTQQSLARPLAENSRSRNALSEGIREGVKTLILARGLDAERPGDDPLREGVLVMAWQSSDLGCPAQGTCPALIESDAAARAAIEVSAACLGGDCADGCLPRLASSSELFYTAGKLDRAKDDQADRAWATELRVRSGTVRELLDRHMVLQLSSLDPSGATYNSDKHLIEWPLYAARQTESTLAYAALAAEPGRWPVRRFGYGLFEDTMGLRGSFVLPGQEVTVTSRDIVQLMLPWLSASSGDKSHTFSVGQ